MFLKLGSRNLSSLGDILFRSGHGSRQVIWKGKQPVQRLPRFRTHAHFIPLRVLWLHLSHAHIISTKSFKVSSKMSPCNFQEHQLCGFKYSLGVGALWWLWKILWNPSALALCCEFCCVRDVGVEGWRSFRAYHMPNAAVTSYHIWFTQHSEVSLLILFCRLENWERLSDLFRVLWFSLGDCISYG